MMNRRQILASAAATALLPRAARAADYDLVIKGGRLIDPARKVDAVLDVAIVSGRIAAIGANIAAGGARSLDASGKIVTAGLIDVHTHAATDPQAPATMLADGVTAWIDAGSNGADGIDRSVAGAKASPSFGRVLINIGRLGMPRDGDTIDIARADVGACKDAIARNRDFVVGIKARLSKEIAGPNDYEALRRAEEASRAFNIPVMIHMGGSVTPLGKLIDLMKKGDIVSHMYAPPPNAIIGDDGKLIPEVIAARARGVKFDIGNGRGGHVRWDIAQKAIAQGFFPDTYSSDWTMVGHQAGTVAMPFNMSYMLNLGASLNDVIAACTIRAADCFPAFKGRGTLAVGSPADVAILELQQGKFEFADTFGNMLPGTQKLVCRNTVLGGKLVV